MGGPDVDALLSGPLGRAVLAELIGLDRAALVRVAGGHTMPSVIATRRANRQVRAIRSETPRGGQPRSVPELIMKRTDQARDDLRELSRVSDPLPFLAIVARVIPGWWFNPVEAAAVRPLEAGAQALRTVAEAITAAPATQWWSEPVNREQRWIGWGGKARPADGPDITRAIGQAVMREAVQEERPPPTTARRISGTWWSRPVGPSVVTTTRDCFGRLPAVEVGCREEWLGEERVEVWALEVDASARVYEVRTPTDWARLASGYARDVTASRHYDWGEWTGHTGPWVLPDWPAVARDWDCIHLSLAGYLGVTGVVLPVSGGATLLAGWNPDQTVWLNDAFSSLRHLGSWQGQPGPAAIPLAN